MHGPLKAGKERECVCLCVLTGRYGTVSGVVVKSVEMFPALWVEVKRT